MIYISDRFRAATVEGVLGDSDQISYETSEHTSTNVKDALDDLYNKMGDVDAVLKSVLEDF